MYNEDLKMAFINDCLSTRIKKNSISATTVNSVFNKTTLLFEKRYDTDAAFFFPEQILEMLKAKNSRSLPSLLNTLVILRKYSAYVHDVLGDCSPNYYEYITSDDLKECVSPVADEAILTREKITSLQSKMLNEVDKAILECLFIGIAGKNLEDLTYLDSTQVDYTTRTVVLTSGKIVGLTDRQIELLHNAFTEQESISYLGDNSASPVSGLGRLYKQRANTVPGDSLDKRFRWVQRRFMIWKDYFNMNVLTMKTVTLSGLVHSIKIGMAKTLLGPRDFLRTQEGYELARQYDYADSTHYVDVIYNRVKKYL